MDGRVHYMKVHPVDEDGKTDYSTYQILRLPSSVVRKLKDMIKQTEEHNDETNKDNQELQ